MGLSASMWTSVSGLMAHGNKMNVVGNNIANVSTIGFKSQRMDFNDYLYINGGSTSGPTQIGAGVSTYAVIGDFSQGSLESTNSVTDIAIDGEGFFKVRQPNTNQMYYTRAGDFYFNANRELQNPEGYKLQGWKIDTSTRLTFKNDSINLGANTKNESAFQGTGTPVDIVLDSWYLEPQRTSSVSFTMGLTSDNENDRATSANGNPMTALFDQWDASKNPPMPNDGYATSSSIKVFDEGGNPHTMTVYYDQVATAKSGENGYTIEGLPAGYKVYEYIVTIPPAEDMRSYGGEGFDPETNTWTKEPESFYKSDPDLCNKNAGMLMTGHLIFDAAGNLVDQTAYTFGGNSTDMGEGNQYAGKPENLDSWQSTRFSSNGLPVFTANFTGQPLANTVNETKVGGVSQAQDYIIELDLGLRNLGGKTGDWSTSGGTLEDLRVNYEPANEDNNKVWPTGAVYIQKEQNEAGDWVIPEGDPVYKPATGTLPSYVTDADVLLKDENGNYNPANKIWGTSTGYEDPDTGKYVSIKDGIVPEGINDPDDLLDLSSGSIAYNDIPRFATAQRMENATSAGTSSFVTQDASQNGYASGVLSGTNITNDGVVYGYYDNGETVPLYQIALYDFHNKQGLRREGGNLYAQTKESGEARQGVAGDNGFGVTRAYNIEQSNVDLSREFVNMITTQRGFQANSKGITTVDTMLETVIGMKR